tara:strand:+ start:1065 stop:2180 length:1116 start_codon:yes stop_codon:yes gene_type:complete
MALIKVNNRGQSADFSTEIGATKNLVINGAMQIAQRATTSGSEGYQTVDRFFTYKESCEQLAVTQTQSTTSPDGFGSSYKLDVTTAESATEANDQYELVTRLEGQDLQHLEHGSSTAKSVTLSFWVRSSKTGTYCISLYKRDTTRNITSTYAISSANTWEKKTVTFAGDTSGAIDNDANRSLDIGWKLLIGSNFTGTASTTWGSTTDARTANGHTATWGSSTSDDFYLTGVQLEVGSSATDFEHRSVGQETQLCKRYFQRFGGAQNKVICSVYPPSNTELGLRFQFSPEMRSTPSIDWTSDTTNLTYRYQGNASQNFTRASISSDGGMSEMTEAGGVVWFAGWSHGRSSGGAGELRIADNTTFFLKFDAEL